MSILKSNQITRPFSEAKPNPAETCQKKIQKSRQHKYKKNTNIKQEE